VIAAESPEAHNSFATPEVIRSRREVIQAGGRFRVSLPPQSVSVIVLRVR
jgi:O-glycosyl hydrolase